MQYEVKSQTARIPLTPPIDPSSPFFLPILEHDLHSNEQASCREQSEDPPSPGRYQFVHQMFNPV
jgi:hypothetical protein